MKVNDCWLIWYSPTKKLLKESPSILKTSVVGDSRTRNPTLHIGDPLFEPAIDADCKISCLITAVIKDSDYIQVSCRIYAVPWKVQGPSSVYEVLGSQALVPDAYLNSAFLHVPAGVVADQVSFDQPLRQAGLINLPADKQLSDFFSSCKFTCRVYTNGTSRHLELKYAPSRFLRLLYGNDEDRCWLSNCCPGFNIPAEAPGPRRFCKPKNHSAFVCFSIRDTGKSWEDVSIGSVGKRQYLYRGSEGPFVNVKELGAWLPVYKEAADAVFSQLLPSYAAEQT